MKIVIQARDVRENDCYRYDFFTMVEGKEYLLAPSALDNGRTRSEILETARKFFGEGVELAWWYNMA